MFRWIAEDDEARTRRESIETAALQGEICPWRRLGGNRPDGSRIWRNCYEVIRTRIYAADRRQLLELRATAFGFRRRGRVETLKLRKSIGNFTRYYPARLDGGRPRFF